MTKEKRVRLTDQQAESIELDIKTKNLPSEQEWLSQAIDHFLTCKKEDSSAQMHLIVLKWPASCLKHGDMIEAGNWAYYGRGIGAICLDAFIERIGDKALIAKYLKMREYQQIIKSLKNEADRLADKVESGQMNEKLDKIYKNNSELHQLILSYFQKSLGTDEEKRALEEIIQLSKETFVLIRDIQQFLLRKKKLEKPVYEA